MPFVSHPTPNLPDISLWALIPLVISSVILGLLIGLPIIGVLARHRINYNPKGLSLDPESNPTVGVKIDTYWAMAKRVYEVEGLKGYFKGMSTRIRSSYFRPVLNCAI